MRQHLKSVTRARSHSPEGDRHSRGAGRRTWSDRAAVADRKPAARRRGGIGRIIAGFMEFWLPRKIYPGRNGAFDQFDDRSAGVWQHAATHAPARGDLPPGPGAPRVAGWFEAHVDRRQTLR